MYRHDIHLAIHICDDAQERSHDNLIMQARLFERARRQCKIHSGSDWYVKDICLHGSRTHFGR